MKMQLSIVFKINLTKMAKQYFEVLDDGEIFIPPLESNGLAFLHPFFVSCCNMPYIKKDT